MDKEVNNIELNAILFYADYLSMKETSTPVTDNCKYFFIYRFPINSAFMADVFPIYDEDNPYFKQSRAEYMLIKDKFGEDGVLDFISNIGELQASGMCDGTRLLQYINQYADKKQRNKAFEVYEDYINNIEYFHTTLNEDGNPQETKCSKYVYHVERMRSGSKLANGIRKDSPRYTL